MGKNGNGEGSIRQCPGGRWEGRYHDADGKRRSVYGKTRKEVVDKLATKIANKDTEQAEQWV